MVVNLSYYGIIKLIILIGNSMFDFKNLNEAKNKTSKNENIRDDKSEQYYDDALKNIEVFKNTKDKTYLENAVKNLNESIAIKRTNAKPYLKLAYIFYVIDEISMSVKYLNIAKSLDSDLPDIIKLQNLISNEKY